MLKSKIHRAVVTDANLNYVGSVTIDEDLLMQRISTRARADGEHQYWRWFKTYAIAGRGREISANGCALGTAW